MVTAEYRRREPEKSLLHQIVRENLETFFAVADARAPDGRGLPRYVRGAFERYLDCGVLAKGFVRVRCPDCGYDTVVGFSCKERGLCPSCTGRRMDETAAHLVDRVFPKAPVRQWVLSMPHPVRFYLAKDSALLTGVLRIFIDEIFKDYRRRSRRKGARCGGVTSIQRYGGAVNLNVHFHSLLLDGVYAMDEATGEFRFHRLEEPSAEGIGRLAWILRTRILAFLRKRGCFVGGDPASEAAAEEDQAPTLFDAVQAAAVREWVAFSDPPRPVPKIGRREEWSLAPIPEKMLCARAEGFSLHAELRVTAGDREGLERVCRYVLRPPFAEERITRLPDGRIAYGFRRPRPDGSTHVVLEPVQFLEKLAALVPPPRAHYAESIVMRSNERSFSPHRLSLPDSCGPLGLRIRE